MTIDLETVLTLNLVITMVDIILFTLAMLKDRKNFGYYVTPIVLAAHYCTFIVTFLTFGSKISPQVYNSWMSIIMLQLAISGLVVGTLFLWNTLFLKK